MAHIKSQKLFLVRVKRRFNDERYDVFVAAKDFGEAASRGAKAMEAKGWYGPEVEAVTRHGEVW
jgi:hypothetical protein